MLQLFAHPFSSYCQKVLVALYENDTPFAWRRVDEPGVMDELSRGGGRALYCVPNAARR